MSSARPDGFDGRVAAVIVAAGSGVRLGAGMPKALVPLHGRPMLNWAVEAFAAHSQIGSVVVVAPADAVATVRTELAGDPAQPAEQRELVTVVAGGSSRQLSVDRGVAALGSGVDLVLVHDAARPLVDSSVITAVISRLRSGASAVIPVLPVADTIKRVDSAGQVVATVDRSELRAVQTPQGFHYEVLVAAHRAAAEGSLSEVTDDAGLVEALGLKVDTVPGCERSFKITTPHDLRLAHQLAAEPAVSGRPV